MAVFADSDISSVLANYAQSNPGSARQYDVSDAIYLNGIGNATPTQYIQFNASGITILSPTKIQITAPIVDVTATSSVTFTTPQVTMTGNLQVNGAIVANGNVTGAGISLDSHVHGGVKAGGDESGGPIG